MTTIGSDPEIFISVDGKVVPAPSLINHGKDNPTTHNGHLLHYDNATMEFTIEPSHTKEQFCREIEGGVEAVLSYLRGKYVDKDISSIILPSYEFEVEQMLAIGKEVFVFGCESDFCAWSGMCNDAPSADDMMRTCGGHIHVGVDEEITPDYQIKLAKMMDFLLGIPSVLLDSDKKRVGRYGKAGAFRGKDYGIEYRVLSNFWLSKKEYMEWVYEQSVKAVETIEDLPKYLSFFGDNTDDVRNVINKHDSATAREFVFEMGVAMP